MGKQYHDELEGDFLKRESIAYKSEEQLKNLFSYQLYSSTSKNVLNGMHTNNAENEENSISISSDNNKINSNTLDSDIIMESQQKLNANKSTSFVGNITLN